MQLTRFSSLALCFAAGIMLTGCASYPSNYSEQYQQPVYAQPQVTPGYAAMMGYGPNGEGYRQPYFVEQARYPYGYAPVQNAPQVIRTAPNGQLILGALAGAAVGNAVNRGDAGSMALGAVVGGAMANGQDPCAQPMNAGTLLGGAVGYGLGNSIGQGDGRVAAQVIGAALGAQAGTVMNGQPRRGPGCR